jgi:hypothetical protein
MLGKKSKNVKVTLLARQQRYLSLGSEFKRFRQEMVCFFQNGKRRFVFVGKDSYPFHSEANKRINLLIRDIDRNRYEGIGEPEPLKYEFTGWWSRRISAHPANWGLDKRHIFYITPKF